ncbi:MAG: hypothetical protein E7545_03470 [Ruminococcaceae bacterium]|nr:hypothetical protein [Oscillospiraceae bacterium]
MFNFKLPEYLLNPSAEDIMPFFVIILYVAIFGTMFAFLFVVWLFKAISVFKMSKKLNLQMPWIGFIPYALPFAYGRLAEQYNGKILKKPIKFSILLLVLQFVPGLLITVFYVLFFVVIIFVALIESEILLFISVLVWYFAMLIIMFASTFAINFFNYLACWNVFAIFGGEKNILYFILSVTLGIEPFLLFALRNKEPQNLKEEFVVPEIVEEN